MISSRHDAFGPLLPPREFFAIWICDVEHRTRREFLWRLFGEDLGKNKTVYWGTRLIVIKASFRLSLSLAFMLGSALGDGVIFEETFTMHRR